jgi:hypothetical protein
MPETAQAVVPPHGTSLWAGFAQRRPAPLIDAAEAPDHLDPSTIDHPATSRCMITTPTATIRVPVDHPTIDHPQRLVTSGVKSRRLGTGGVKSRPTLFRFCTKKIMRFVATALIWNLA